MAPRKSKKRKITVSGQQFEWTLRDNSLVPATARHIVVTRWNAREHGRPVVLGYRNGRFLMLPRGTAFTHELFTQSLDEKAVRSDAAARTPRVEELARMATMINPWLDSVDLTKLAADFSELLFGERKAWECYVQKRITAEELCDLLLARTQLYVPHAFQSPVAAEELEQVVRPEFERELFGGVA